ncbi:MAG: SDR family NAD(P)-dependent oxidoreductase [Pelagimonas sp.]|jgi:histidinol-phosphate aminotransferase|nr:SDR family NAD(P)-dependent oxidoreductase [Pelagimonas sp.]
MDNLSKFHRLRTFAAKATMVTRRAIQHFSTADAVETQMANLPRIDTASDLAGAVVMVTGASQGVGLVLCRALSKAGARVVMVGRRQDALDQAAKSVTGATALAGDVSDPKDATALVSKAEQQVGPIDILVNNAGVGGPWGMPFWQADPGEFAQAIDINLTGAFLMARACAQQATQAGRRLRILNVSSISTGMNGKGFGGYNASKTGLESLTRAMAADGDAAGITTVTVALHSVQTERKKAHDWASHALMPPAEVVIPAFMHAATAPAADVSGRVIASWRFLQDAPAESRLAGPAATLRAIAYPPFQHKGEPTARDPLRFSINDRAENPYPPSPKVAEAITTALHSAPLTHYPEERHSQLTGALAAYHDLPADAFALGPGSWEVLARLVPLFAKHGEEVVSHDPGWFGFNLVCQRAGVVQSRGRFMLGENSGQPSHNLPALLERITPQTRLVYLIHPSNPEGTPIEQSEMDAFLDALPPNLPVIVDEAYIDYADRDDLFDTVKAVQSRNQTIIGLRTFSKFYGLAGARVGYAYARPDIAQLIRNTENIFSLSSLSEAAATAAIQDRAHADQIRAKFSTERKRLFDGLSARGLAPLPSQAPYVLARRPEGIDTMLQQMEDRGTYIARYAFHDDTYMMFPVGAPDTTDLIFEIMDQNGLSGCAA